MSSWTGSALRMRIKIQKGENQPKTNRKITSEDQKKLVPVPAFSMQSYSGKEFGLKMFNVRKITVDGRKIPFVYLRKTGFKFY
jgi:hypothetical protein